MKNHLSRHNTWFAAALLVAGCGTSENSGGGAGSDAGGDAAPILAPEIGTGDHSPASVTLTIVAGPQDDLQAPRDLAFNPRVPDDLWVVNYDDDSVVIIHDASTDSPDPEYMKDWYGDPSGFPANHFMAEPSAIAFGADETSEDPPPAGVGGVPGTFATCGESRNTYDDQAPANDFMGITLWSSDPSVFANAPGHLGLGSHLDMLHNGPYCMGVAHIDANAYWAFAGRARDPDVPACGLTCSFVSEAALVRYDLNEDNGVGNDDHSDGGAYQYVTGEVDYVRGVPSHLTYDATRELLYIADTGNRRIVALDTTTGTIGTALQPLEPMLAYNVVNDAVLTDVVPEAAAVLERPSGLDLHNDLLYVTDNATGMIHAFNLDGTLVNCLDTGRGEGALAGVSFGPDEKLFLVDMKADEVVRIDP